MSLSFKRNFSNPHSMLVKRNIVSVTFIIHNACREASHESYYVFVPPGTAWIGPALVGIGGGFSVCGMVG
jgi:hypothetical protein